MGVSENSGTPKSSHFNRVFHYKPSILRYPNFWKHPYEHPKQVIDTCLKEQNLASTSSVKLQECFELLAETVQVVLGDPELLSLYVPTSMHHMRYKQRKIRENLCNLKIHFQKNSGLELKLKKSNETDKDGNRVRAQSRGAIADCLNLAFSGRLRLLTPASRFSDTKMM